MMLRRLTTLAATILITACAGRSRVASSADAMPPLPVLTRAQWGARPPIAPMRVHTITRITIHHTGERSRADLPLDRKLRALQTFSQRDEIMSNGAAHHAWPDVPYHYYIDTDGNIAEARDWHFAGDTNTSYDPAGHLLIVLEGNFDQEQPTPDQLAALRAMVSWASSRWHIPADSLAGHRDFARTDCPGDSLYPQLPALRAMVRARR